jgi:hypothetical protein
LKTLAILSTLKNRPWSGTKKWAYLRTLITSIAPKYWNLFKISQRKHTC